MGRMVAGRRTCDYGRCMRASAPILALAATALAGCGALDGLVPARGPSTVPPPVATSGAPPVVVEGQREEALMRGELVEGQSPEALDTTTAEARSAALGAAPGGRDLGSVAVTLGDPSVPGLWLRGGIVTEAGPGVVTLPSGASVAVELIPGAGPAQLSLAAYRALNLALTDLPTVSVSAN
jgi:hypothetical protein